MLKISILYLFLLLLFKNNVMAAATLPKKNTGLFIIGINAYKAEAVYDKNFKSKSFSNNGAYDKNDLSYFLEYGLYDRYSLVANGSLYTTSKYKDNFTSETYQGVGKHEISLKKNYSRDGDKAIQATVSYPIYSRNDETPNYHQHDFEIRHIWDLKANSLFSFQSTELAYRVRFDRPADQIRFAHTAIKPIRKSILLFKLYYLQSLKNNSSESNSFDADIDFDLLTLDLGIALNPQRKWTTNFGITQDVWGRNTGKGQSVYLNFWYRF